MASSLNKVTLIGNLGRDPELKMTPGGQAMARFSIATTETWKDQAGEKQSRTEWHNIVVWGKQAETAEKWLKKGSQVFIEGRIQSREYEGKDGAKKTAYEIRCDHFLMLGGKGQGNSGASAPDAEEPSGAPSHAPSGGQYEDDIPF